MLVVARAVSMRSSCCRSSAVTVSFLMVLASEKTMMNGCVSEWTRSSFDTAPLVWSKRKLPVSSS